MLSEKISIQDIVYNLNKENFWNSCMELNPMTTNEFCNWINEYKKQVQWKEIFNVDLNIKFHDIPFEMQLGIILKFFSDRTNVIVKFKNLCDKHLVIYALCDLFDQCELLFNTYMKKLIS